VNLALSQQDFEDAQRDLENAVAALDEVIGEYEDAKLQFH
jgi:exonuclease VII small subunit